MTDICELDEDLDSDEVALRDRVRTWVVERFLPLVPTYWHKGDFPMHLVEEVGALGCFGSMIEGHGCPGFSARKYGLVMRELERGDSGLRTLASVQGALAMGAIAQFGSLEQKQEWLPLMASGARLGCFALTEPGFGSNPAGLQTQAHRDGDDWILNGEKKWIGNADVAHAAIVWAKVGDSDDARSIRGFLVPAETTGYEASLIENKFSLRVARTCSIRLDGVRVPSSALLPGTEIGLRSALNCLDSARYGIAWGVLGAAEGCIDEVRAYAGKREIFDRPLASFQLFQSKLAGMATRLAHGQLVAYRIAMLKDAGRLREEQVSMAKFANVEIAQEIARTSREMLGGVGITDDFVAMRHMANLESVATYEGTSDIHRLVIGRWLTGLQAFR